MGLVEIERFIADLKSKSLRFETGNDHRAAAFVALAASKGCAFTNDEVKAHVKARFAAGGITLPAAQLDRVCNSGLFLRFDKNQ